MNGASAGGTAVKRSARQFHQRHVRGVTQSFGALTGVLAASLIVAFAALVSGAASAGTAAASTTPTIAVSQTSNLLGHQVVKVSGNGFAPNQLVDIVQCGTSGACTTTDTTVGYHIDTTSNRNGKLKPVKFQLLTGTIDLRGDQCGVPTSGPTGCSLRARDTAGDSATADLTFQIPAINVSGVPSGGAVGNLAVTLTGSGFPVGDPVDFTECSPTYSSSQSSSDCDTSNVSGQDAKKNGTVKVSFKLGEGGTYSDSDSGVCAAAVQGGSGTCVIAGTDVDNTVMTASQTFDWATPTISITPTSFPDTNGPNGPTEGTVTASGFPIGDEVLGAECQGDLSNCDSDNLISGYSEGSSGTIAWLPDAPYAGAPVSKGLVAILTDDTNPAYPSADGSVTPTSGAAVQLGDVTQAEAGSGLAVSVAVTINP